MIYFAWVSKEESFTNAHLRHDCDITALTLLEEEGVPAQLVLTCHKGESDPPIGRYGILSYKKDVLSPEEILFKGPLVSFQRQDAFFIEYTFRIPNKVEKDTENYPSDPLFPEAWGAKRLEHYPYSYYWNRTNEAFSLSHALMGDRHKLSLGEAATQFSYERLPCLREVTLTLGKQWTQSLEGTLDLGPHIASKFKENCMNTYTGRAFARSWPRPGMSLGRYRVVESSLEEVFTQEEKKSEKSSKKVCISKKTTPHFKKEHTYCMKRTWFQGTLLLLWKHLQPRRESLVFTLATRDISSSTPPYPLTILLQEEEKSTGVKAFLPFQTYHMGDRARYRGKLYEYIHHTPQSFRVFSRNIPETATIVWEERQDFPLFQDSFFTTPRGVQAFEHGLQWAASFLTWQSRCLKVCLTLGIEHAFLTTNHRVELEDPSLPTGKITGKVVKYLLQWNEGKGYPQVFLTLACVPTPENAQQDPYNPLLGETFCAFPTAMNIPTRGIFYKDFTGEHPKDEYKERVFKQINTLVQECQVVNPPEEQEKKFQEITQLSELQKQDIATRVSLRFTPLHSFGTLEHHIGVTLSLLRTSP